MTHQAPFERPLRVTEMTNDLTGIVCGTTTPQLLAKQNARRLAVLPIPMNDADLNDFF